MSDTPETSLKCAECGTTLRKDVAIFSAYQKDFCGPDHAFDWSAKMIEALTTAPEPQDTVSISRECAKILLSDRYDMNEIIQLGVKGRPLCDAAAEELEAALQQQEQSYE